MTPPQLLALGLVIGANNLAVALALGALGQASRRLRIVTVFGVAEFLVPLVGIWLGRSVATRLATSAGWVGAAVLVALGVWVVVAGLRGSTDDERLARRATTWRGLVVLAAALSVDNLIVGFSLGLGDVAPVVVAAVIALCSVAFTWVGLGLGDGSRRHWERRAEVASGVLLVVLGVADALGAL